MTFYPPLVSSLDPHNIVSEFLLPTLIAGTLSTCTKHDRLRIDMLNFHLSLLSYNTVF